MLQLGELDAARAALATEKAAHAASQNELRAAEETRRQLHNTIQVRACDPALLGEQERACADDRESSMVRAVGGDVFGAFANEWMVQVHVSRL